MLLIHRLLQSAHCSHEPVDTVAELLNLSLGRLGFEQLLSQLLVLNDQIGVLVLAQTQLLVQVLVCSGQVAHLGARHQRAQPLTVD